MAAYLSWGYVFPVWMPSTTQTNEIWSKNTGLRQNNNIEVAAHAVTSISFTNPKTFFTKKKWFGFAPYGTDLLQIVGKVHFQAPLKI